MPKSTSSCNSILALIYNATLWANVAINATSSPITDIYVSLHTANPGASGTQATSEATFTNYDRVAVARSTSGWTAPSAGATANVAAIEFPQCGVTGNTITYAMTGRDASGAGLPFHYGALNASIAVSDQIQPRFAAGAVTITET